MFVNLKLSVNFLLIIFSFSIIDILDCFHIHIVNGPNPVNDQNHNIKHEFSNEGNSLNSPPLKPIEQLANFLMNDIFSDQIENKENQLNTLNTKKRVAKFKPKRKKEIFESNDDNGISRVVVQEFIQNDPFFPTMKPRNRKSDDIFKPFKPFDDDFKDDFPMPLSMQTPLNMPMIVVKRRNLKGFDNPNQRTPIDMFKKMDEMFENFFEDVLNGNNNKSNFNKNLTLNGLVKTNNQLTENINKIDILNNDDHKISNNHLGVDSNILLNSFENSIFNNDKTNKNYNIVSKEQEILDKNSLSFKVVNREKKELLNSDNVPNSELLIEKEKFIQKSLTNDNIRLDSIKNNDKKENSEKIVMNKIQTVDEKQSNEKQIGEIKLSDILKGNLSAKIIKYFFYVSMMVFIIFISLMLIKCLMETNSKDKEIKTKHSINEIEDELNNMRERKLF